MITGNKHKGQVALVMVLIVTAVSALAVSLASRSTIDTNIQKTESESIQALILAQTGIEQLIMNPMSITINEASYSANKTSVGMEGYTVGRVNSGSTLELNLVNADFDSLTGFKVYWKPDVDGVGGHPAVLVSLVDTNGVVTDYAYDYQGDNGFDLAEDGASEGYEKSTPSINISSSVSKVRVTVLGTSALMKFVPLGSGAVFPSQITLIKSVGLVQSSGNSVKYGLEFDESVADTVPAVFDYPLFSGGSIIQ